MWWLISRVQLARETVVDELSILVTNARRTYMDTLLAFADDTGLASSAAFSARRHLFHRVMLLSKEGGMSSIRIAAGSCVLVLALGAGTFGVANAFPLYRQVQDQRPPRDPLTAEMHHRVAEEYWERANKNISLTPEQKLDAILKGIEADDRALAMKPDYVDAMIYKNLFLRMQANMTEDPQQREVLIQQADELRNKAIEARKALGLPGMAAAAAPAPPMSEEYKAHLAQLNPVRIGGQLKTPIKIRDVKPEYPADARANRVQGVVIIEALIDTTGRIADARVLRSIPLFDEAALGAVRQWEFVPMVIDGVPQNIVMTVTINFSLQ
jgi:TonB family protein